MIMSAVFIFLLLVIFTFLIRSSRTNTTNALIFAVLLVLVAIFVEIFAYIVSEPIMHFIAFMIVLYAIGLACVSLFFKRE